MTDLCPCLRCTLNRCYDAWMDAQLDHSIDQREVTSMAVQFLGDVVSNMPLYEHICPIRILIIGNEAKEIPDVPPRVN